MFFTCKSVVHIKSIKLDFFQMQASIDKYSEIRTKAKVGKHLLTFYLYIIH